MHDVAFAPPSLLAGALAAIGAPALGFLALAIAVVVGRTPGERTIAWGTRWATVTSLVGACSLAWAVLRGAPPTEVPLGLLVGAMGKAAQLPFSGWLPRAMEGPTPSSALFYGALSVHAGAFLLLRASPALAAHPTVAVAAAAVGLSTALVATLVGRVQPDVKGALAHAAMTQVGLVFVEIALGLHGLALIHMVGHAILRARQLLQAPGVLEHDRALVAAAGGVRGRTGAHLERLLPAALQRRLYGLALDRFGLDAAVDRLVVRPVLALARALDDLDRTWSGDLHGVDPRDRRAEVSSPDLTPLPAPPSRGGEG